MILRNLAVLEYSAGNVDRAIELSLALLGHPLLLQKPSEAGVTFNNLGAYLLLKGQFAEARPNLEKAFSFLVEGGGFALDNLLEAWAILAGAEGRLVEAAQLIGYIDSMRARRGIVRGLAEIPLYHKLMAILDTGLPLAERDALKAMGAQWTEAEATAFVTNRLLPAQDSGTTDTTSLP